MLVEKKNIYPFFDEQVKCNKTEKNKLSSINNDQWRRN